MRQMLMPDHIARPASAYHHGIVFSAPARFARLAGQLGERPDGTLEPDIRAQADQAWQNVAAILAEGGMTLADITKVTSYLVARDDIAGYVEVHKRHLAEFMPPWTLILVQGLGKAEYLVEIDVEAAR